jgi:hypothetical protein
MRPQQGCPALHLGVRVSNKFNVQSSADPAQVPARQSLAAVLRNSAIPDTELGANLGLYLERMHLSRILLMHDLFRKVLNVPGVVLEFGVRWGQNIALFNTFRGMYEPFNYTRKIVGFDTFQGFPVTDEIDTARSGKALAAGDYSVTKDWRASLEQALAIHDQLSPLPHIKKWELIVGDATATFPKYLEDHPEQIVSLAYFDFDIYRPTKVCLELLLPRLTKGSIVAFDELNCPDFPGETVAVQEVLGVNAIRLNRDPNNPLVTWFEWQ